VLFRQSCIDHMYVGSDKLFCIFC